MSLNPLDVKRLAVATVTTLTWYGVPVVTTVPLPVASLMLLSSVPQYSPVPAEPTPLISIFATVHAWFLAEPLVVQGAVAVPV